MDYFEQIKIKRTIVELVECIFKKYEMYFGYEKNINHVYYYIQGYISSKIESNEADGVDEKFHYDFNEWLYKKYNKKVEHRMAWNQLYIELFVDEDERLNTFYFDFIEFINYGDDLNVLP